MKFESSWGTIECDSDGYVINLDADREIRGEHNYLFDISRFNLVELREFYAHRGVESPDEDDILVVGWWSHSGEYSEPDFNWRKEMYT